jgi:hypothetical protein
MDYADETNDILDVTSLSKFIDGSTSFNLVEKGSFSQKGEISMLNSEQSLDADSEMYTTLLIDHDPMDSVRDVIVDDIKNVAPQGDYNYMISLDETNADNVEEILSQFSMSSVTPFDTKKDYGTSDNVISNQIQSLDVDFVEGITSQAGKRNNTSHEEILFTPMHEKAANANMNFKFSIDGKEGDNFKSILVTTAANSGQFTLDKQELKPFTSFHPYQPPSSRPKLEGLTTHHGIVQQNNTSSYILGPTRLNSSVSGSHGARTSVFDLAWAWLREEERSTGLNTTKGKNTADVFTENLKLMG